MLQHEQEKLKGEVTGLQQILPQICFYCDHLLGCAQLEDSKGTFVPERVITEKYLRDCLDWEPVGPQQKSVRETLYGIQGDGCIRILHSVPNVIMQDLDKQVKEGEIDVSEMPDFEKMRIDGMTVEDREEQLRYEHDESGNVVRDLDSRKCPRPSYVLRKFACDPNGTIGLDHSAGMGWNNNQVIKFILDSEVEQGFITSPKKAKGKPKQTRAAKEVAPKETKMAGEGRRVLVKRNKKNTEQQEPGKIAEPPRRKGAGTTKEASGDIPEANKLNELTTVIDGLHQRLEAIEKQLESIGKAIETVGQKAVDGLTILHDVMVADGALKEAEPKLDETGGILSYLSDPE